MKHINDAGPYDLSALMYTVRMANDAISALVSALSHHVVARTINQQKCDYCGEQYPTPGPFAWASHDCRVLTATETIISECVQQLLRERFVAKSQLERLLPTDVNSIRRSA